ncbi:MAG: HAMP domain-containing protein [Candidatus Omnitrophica bacterium]|nr:HAMP domain-containing protein [Candidatus Omnitrophota bacterium]
MKIRSKIFLTFLISSAVLVIVGGVTLYYFSAGNIKKEVANNLKTAAQNKANWINSYLLERERNMKALADTQDAKTAFSKIMAYYYKERFYDLDKSRYKTIYKEMDPYFRSYLETYKYHDILFIGAAYGHVMYTATRETSLGTNLGSGPYKDSALAILWKKVAGKKDVDFTDFEFYGPNKKPSMFIGAPALNDQNEVYAVVALQISIKEINDVMKDYTGLGSTGDTYIVGKDFLMRSDSRHSKESTILKLKVDTENIKSCFRDKKNDVEGERLYTNYRNEKVLGTSVFIPRMDWVLVAEISQKEAFLSLNHLLAIFLGVGIVLFLLIYFTSNWIGKKISAPIIRLEKSSGIIMRGDLSHRTGINSTDEIGQLSSAFDKMTGTLEELYGHLEEKVRQRTIELEKANKELDSFVYTASHDLKAPLRGISSFASFLEEDYKNILDAEGKDYVSEIKKGAIRLNNLIDDLLTLSRISRIKNPYELVDMNELIKSIVERIAFDIKENNVEIKVQEGLPGIVCDRIKMGEVLLNLLNNAVKFSSKRSDGLNPKVEVAYRETEEGHLFSVKDNGIGIEPQYQDKVFGLFKKLHKDSEYSGTGAGLSIVKTVIDDQGGRIWIDSDIGRGAAFYFTIPKDLKAAPLEQIET